MKNYNRCIWRRLKKNSIRKYSIPYEFELRYLIIYITNDNILKYRQYKYEPYTINNSWEIVAMYFKKKKKKWVEYKTSYFIFR